MTDAMTTPQTRDAADWPALSYPEWKDTYATLHLWTQIVGKLRLERAPWLNHSWHVVYYVTSRGLTTSPIPYGARTFEVVFDFVDHKLCIHTNDGRMSVLPLRPMTVAAFYREVFARLADLDIHVKIYPKPNEMEECIPFDQDTKHASYDAEQANRFWRALYQADRVLKRFRTRFVGKASPVHFFWGGFDLAVTRFSGRLAPPHPGGVPHLPDWVAQEAYSQEVSSCGFWPGGEPLPEAVFYAYAYPEPKGFAQAPLRPDGAKYHDGLREFVLPYEVVRTSKTPDETLLDFLQSTYEAAANLAEWDRAALERPERLPKPR